MFLCDIWDWSSFGYNLLTAFALHFRSLELFFAASPNNRGEHMVDGKSPHLCRKFSSPPPLAVSRTSSPVRARKLSLTSSLNSRIGALDLTTSSSSSSPTSYSPTASPPPHTGKVPLGLSTGPLCSWAKCTGYGREHRRGHLGDLCSRPKWNLQSVFSSTLPWSHPTLAAAWFPTIPSGRLSLFVCLGAVFSFLHTKNGYSVSWIKSILADSCPSVAGSYLSSLPPFKG